MKVSSILNKTTIPWIIICGLLVYLFMVDKEVKTVYLPSSEGVKEIIKPVPVIQYDTIVEKGSIKVVEVENPYNHELLERYNKALDSIKKLSLYKQAVTHHTYVESLEDSIISITVRSKTTGTLDHQNISYKTKPREIEIRSKVKPKLYLSGFGRSQLGLDGQTALGLKADLVNEKTIITAGYDSRENVTLGIGFKLF